MQDYLEALEEEGQVTFEEFKSYCGHFYETCIGFIQEWCVPFLAPLHCIDSVSLKKVPCWKYVQGYCCFIKTVITDFTLVEEELFDNCHVRRYILQGS